jgi:hypothetical protein
MGSAYQSFGLLPLTTTLVTTSFGFGSGMGEFFISTLVPGWIIASFMTAYSGARVIGSALEGSLFKFYIRLFWRYVNVVTAEASIGI